MSGATVGAFMGLIFGAIWGVTGATALCGRWRFLGASFSIAISSALGVALVILPHPEHEATFRGTIYGVSVVLESFAIAAAVASLRRSGRLDLIVPAVGCIVGLHFLGLWRATDAGVFAWTAAGMCASGIAALVIIDPRISGCSNMRTVITGLGCAIVLWASSASTFI